jgi:hypothetical protein
VITDTIFGMHPARGEFYHDPWTDRTLDPITHWMIYTSHMNQTVSEKNRNRSIRGKDKTEDVGSSKPRTFCCIVEMNL